jgi:hypothetical protein
MDFDIVVVSIWVTFNHNCFVPLLAIVHSINLEKIGTRRLSDGVIDSFFRRDMALEGSVDAMLRDDGQGLYFAG